MSTATTWQMTPMLRWREVKEFADVAPVRVLEQCWICLETGEESWKPTPVLTVAAQAKE